MFRLESTWRLALRKEDNAFRGILCEDGAHTPEHDGQQFLLLYGPRATIKLRCTSAEIADAELTEMYGAPQPVTEKVHSLEWSLVASIAGGKIPDRHRQQPVVQILNPVKFNVETYNAGKDSQGYDKGLERFVGKHNPDIPMTATMSIEKGCHGEYALGIFFQQEKRRCLLTETLIGQYDDVETFWYTMMMWAKFQPRAATPRKEPGQLYYPAAATHIIEKYWDFLNDPIQHPDCTESDFTRVAMTHFAEALSVMDLSSFKPAVDAEASEKAWRAASKAALSRTLPIQDAPDFWGSNTRMESRSSSGTDGPSQEGSSVVGTDLGPGLGSMGTCVAQGNPP
jgi:hypothetical protein